MVPEKRRQNHISLIDEKHPLLPIALACIADQHTDRPSAHKVCVAIEKCVSSKMYETSQASLVQLQQQIEQLKDTIAQKNQQVQ